MFILRECGETKRRQMKMQPKMHFHSQVKVHRSRLDMYTAMEDTTEKKAHRIRKETDRCIRIQDVPWRVHVDIMPMIDDRDSHEIMRTVSRMMLKHQLYDETFHVGL